MKLHLKSKKEDRSVTPEPVTSQPDLHAISDIDMAREDVEKRGFALSVVRDGKRILQSKRPGISALVTAIDYDRFCLRGASAADRILGKAAAMLFVYSRVSRIFASLASRDASATLQEFGVPFESVKNVREILNRDQTSACPFESLVRDVKTPEEAFERLRICRISG